MANTSLFLQQLVSFTLLCSLLLMMIGLMIKILGNIKKEDSYRGGGAVSQSVRLACGRLGIQIPGASYLSRKSRQ